MVTGDVEVGEGWSDDPVVPIAATWFVITVDEANVRLATTAADATKPLETVRGHQVKPDAGATRSLFQSGAVFLKKDGTGTTTVAVTYGTD
jgi:hypothetical protein